MSAAAAPRTGSHRDPIPARAGEGVRGPASPRSTAGAVQHLGRRRRPGRRGCRCEGHRLAALGVARISHGPEPNRLAMQLMTDAARTALRTAG